MLPDMHAFAFPLSVVLLLASAPVAAADAGEAFLTEFPPPDTQVLKAAKLALEKYRDTRPFKTEWTIKVNEQKGVIETNWFPEHKGEVRLKAQIVVWGKSYRVDIWQRVGWIFPSVEKTEISRRTERHVQDGIKDQLLAGAS